MAENNNQDTQRKGGLIYKIIGLAAIVVVVLLIIFIGPKDGEKAKSADKNSKDQAETPSDALSVAQPVVSGDYEYTWQGVKWIFDTESEEVAGTGQTWLKMEFADFTRNGSAITFGRPYKLGVHPGTCKEVDYLDTSSESGIPFAYAECSDGTITRDFVVLQEDQDVVVKMNETKDGEASGWQDWYKIDVTEIVR